MNTEPQIAHLEASSNVNDIDSKTQIALALTYCILIILFFIAGTVLLMSIDPWKKDNPGSFSVFAYFMVSAEYAPIFAALTTYYFILKYFIKTPETERKVIRKNLRLINIILVCFMSTPIIFLTLIWGVIFLFSLLFH